MGIHLDGVKGKVTINGKEYDAKGGSVEIKKGGVYVNGKKVDSGNSGNDVYDINADTIHIGPR